MNAAKTARKVGSLLYRYRYVYGRREKPWAEMWYLTMDRIRERWLDIDYLLSEKSME